MVWTLQDLVSQAIRTKEPAQAAMSSIVDCLWNRVSRLEPDRPYRVVEDIIVTTINQNKDAGLVASAVVRPSKRIFLSEPALGVAEPLLHQSNQHRLTLCVSACFQQVDHPV